MNIRIAFVVIMQLWYCCYSAPVTKNEKEAPKEADDSFPMDMIHYNRYLKEVVNVLESDPGFKKKLEEASEEDIKSGKIANELHFVDHKVRTTLNELKRVELERLLDVKHQILAQEQELSQNDIDFGLHGHLDHSNKHSFETDDLKKLIAKATQDMLEIDKRRREEFKQYELQKEYEKQDKINHTKGEDERAKMEKHYKDLEEKHKKHEPLHQPGHKAQLEEVWQEKDHMQQKFDANVFFNLHDPNSDGLWDEAELKAVFINELNKLYQDGAAEDDLREREEEMERMRESVMREVDTNRDGFISRLEFLEHTRRREFQQDQGWKGIDEQGRPFTDEELQEYIRQQQMMHPREGYYPPPGGYHPNQVPQGYAPQYQGQPQYQQQQPPPGYYQQQAQPPQYQPQGPNQQYQHPNQQPPVQQYQGQPPNQQYQQQPNQPPNQQYQQQPSQGQAPNQPPPAYQGQPLNQPPPPAVQQQQANQLPPQNQPSPQVNPGIHQAGKPIQAP